MKKTLLFVGLGLTTLFTANAQISFEESEGFTVGPLATQNGWGVSAAAPGSALISTDYANDGVNSLEILGLDGTAHALVGAFSPVDVVTNNIITVSYDIYLTDISDAASDFFVGAQSPSQALLTSRERFTYTGTVMVVATDGTLAYQDTGATFAVGQWYNMTAVHTFDAGTIEYYLDGELIYTGDVFGADNVEQMTFLNDNYDSAAYFDNVQVVAGLGHNEQIVNTLAVYPNPVINTVSIKNPENVHVNIVTITDLNGRVVKQVKPNTVSDITVDLSDLSSGTYMMKMISAQGSTVKKIIKS
jgi:hypothetical protein